jgi:hypothetical protein
MTTPDERRRNLIWGREALEEQSTDAGLPKVWRDESERYPPLSTLSACSDAELERLQVQYAQVLSASKDLFQRMRANRACSEQRRYSLLVILRHFY